MISHDLRTPLTSISGNAEILLSEEDRITPEKTVMRLSNHPSLAQV